MTKLCSNCDQPLSGRQRLYCSDRCRKAISRKPDKPGQDQPENRENQVPANIFGLFMSELSGLESREITSLRQALIDVAQHSDRMLSYMVSAPHAHVCQHIITSQQVVSKIMWRLVDDFGILPDEQRTLDV